MQGTGNDVGVGVTTLINLDKRLQLIGTLPGELQSYLIYTASPMASAQSPDAAREFIHFLELPATKASFAAATAADRVLLAWRELIDAERQRYLIGFPPEGQRGGRDGTAQGWNRRSRYCNVQAGVGSSSRFRDWPDARHLHAGQGRSYHVIARSNVLVLDRGTHPAPADPVSGRCAFM